MLEYNKGERADKAERSRVMVIRTQYLERLRPFYDSELVKVITGIRRCGKSTILRQVIAEIKENGIEDSHIVYINFEDYKYHKLTDADAFYEYVEQKIIDESKYYLFFDEIQNVNNFELVVNSFRATHNVSILLPVLIPTAFGRISYAFKWQDSIFARIAVQFYGVLSIQRYLCTGL